MPSSEEGLPEIKFPGDKGKAQNEHVCTNCGSTLEEGAQECPNCHQTKSVKLGPYQRKPSDKGPEYNPFSNNNPVYVPRKSVVPITRASSLKNAKHKKDKKDEEVNVDGVYTSEPFDMCGDPKSLLRRKKPDVDKERDIWNSCRDLEIDR